MKKQENENWQTRTIGSGKERDGFKGMKTRSRRQRRKSQNPGKKIQPENVEPQRKGPIFADSLAKCRDIIASLDTGDILLFNSTGIFACCTQMVFRSEWDHAAVVIRRRKPRTTKNKVKRANESNVRCKEGYCTCVDLSRINEDRIEIMEATYAGSHVYYMEERLARRGEHDTLIAVRRLKRRDDEDFPTSKLRDDLETLIDTIKGRAYQNDAFVFAKMYAQHGKVGNTGNAKGTKEEAQQEDQLGHLKNMKRAHSNDHRPLLEGQDAGPEMHHRARRSQLKKNANPKQGLNIKRSHTIDDDLGNSLGEDSPNKVPRTIPEEEEEPASRRTAAHSQSSSGLKVDKKEVQKLFCSQIVTASLQQLEILRKDFNTRALAPSDFCSTGRKRVLDTFTKNGLVYEKEIYLKYPGSPYTRFLSNMRARMRIRQLAPKFERNPYMHIFNVDAVVPNRVIEDEVDIHAAEEVNSWQEFSINSDPGNLLESLNQSVASSLLHTTRSVRTSKDLLASLNNVSAIPENSSKPGKW